MVLKPQDVLVVLKFVAMGQMPWSYAQLAVLLGMSPSQLHAAFHGRGNGDYLMSPDMEDIVSVLDGRPEVVDEVNNAGIELRQYLARHFATLLGDHGFLAALPGHLASDTDSSVRVQIVMDRIERIAGPRS